MKDMYTFDGSDKAARYTYDLVNESYVAVLKRLQLEYLKGNFIVTITVFSLDITNLFSRCSEWKYRNDGRKPESRVPLAGHNWR